MQTPTYSHRSPPHPHSLFFSHLLSFFFLLLLLLCLVPTPAHSQCNGCLTFTQINDDSSPSNPSVPWTPRSGGTLYSHPLPITFKNSSDHSQWITAPPHSLVVFGGDSFANNLPCNDVWLSSDRGAHWHLIAGNSSSGKRNEAAPFPFQRTYEAFVFASIALAPPSSLSGNASADGNFTVSVARIGGRFLDEPDNDGRTVWVTRDMLSWFPFRFDDTPSHYTHASSVMGSAGTLFLTGGFLEGDANPRSSADVWRSDDSGRSWTCITTNAAFGPRNSHSSLLLTGAQTPAVAGADVVLVVGGTDGPRVFNDVWASSDDCVTWTRLTAAAAFSPRRDFSLLATPDGVVLLVAGWDASTSFNSLFASFDGGYTWNEFRHRSADGFRARHAHMAALGADGFLYLAGGRNQLQQYLYDILRSSISMTNLTALQLVFQVDVGRCGVGLYCLDDNVMMRSDGHVYCARCSANDAINQSLFIAVVVVVTMTFIAFMVWRNFGLRGRSETPIGLNEHLVNKDEENE